jgi:hypothetical protein
MNAGTNTLSTTPPRRHAGDHPDRGADDEREQERDPDEEDRVRQRPADHLGHRRRVVRRRETEIEVHDPAQVRDVVLPDRLIATAEHRLVRLDQARVGGKLGGVEMLKQSGDRVPRHQPGKQEVDRQRNPDCEGVEDEATSEPAHVDSPSLDRRAVEGSARRLAGGS